MSEQDKDSLLKIAEGLESKARELRKMAEDVDVGRLPPKTAYLSPQAVQAIRNSDDSDTSLAMQYGVSRFTVWSIRKGLSYKAVTP